MDLKEINMLLEKFHQLNIPDSMSGVSVITSLISYNLDKKKKLRENPYNYLLEIEGNISASASVIL